MSNYLACTSHDWAIEAVCRAERKGENWTCLVDRASASASVEDMVARVQPRYIFFLHWNKIVPASVFEIVECINFHCTPLPYGRGGSPIENMILTGFSHTAMTAHRMTAKVDAGPIYLQVFGISLEGSRAEILRSFISPCARMMREIIDDSPHPIEQFGEPVYFKRLTPDERQEFWSKR